MKVLYGLALALVLIGPVHGGEQRVKNVAALAPSPSEVSNTLQTGAIDAGIYKAGKLLATR